VRVYAKEGASIEEGKVGLIRPACTFGAKKGWPMKLELGVQRLTVLFGCTILSFFDVSPQLLV
jgi:hypothetical protein